MAALKRAVCLLASRAPPSAPACAKVRIMASSPLKAAENSAVCCAWFCASTGAPLSRRSLAMAPPRAKCSTAWPSESTAAASARRSSSSRATSCCARAAAEKSAVCCLASRASTSQRRSSSSLAHSVSSAAKSAVRPLASTSVAPRPSASSSRPSASRHCGRIAPKAAVLPAASRWSTRTPCLSSSSKAGVWPPAAAAKRAVSPRSFASSGSQRWLSSRPMQGTWP
mmetsp:Transcript_72849/g.235679  ORF Transcript_72849/g.235679 Transcript_72849/m.235679 type:complete len:226 (+) Transcript_72849:410-1087(+)